MDTKIYALHGFLGLPSDWDFIEGNVSESFESLDVFSLCHPCDGLYNWGSALNHYVAKQPKQRRILLGYSQGGRLAMHALIDGPEVWDGAIIVSANTGLKVGEDKAARLQIDRNWAQRFLKDPWEKLIEDWDAQTVFQGVAPSFQRKEEDYSRSNLAQAIEGWSVGNQGDLEGSLAKLSIPILWVGGEKDLKYAKLAKKMAAIHPHSSCWIAPEAGHRVPWECPKLFLKEIHSFLRN